MIQIIQATADTAPKIHALSQARLHSEGWSLQQYIDAARDSLLLCAVQGDSLLGFLQADVVYDTANLNLIATDPAYARQGVARRLIATACDILDEYRAQNGFESLIFSLEVRSQNIPARSLYQSCGFEQAGLRRRFYTDPDDDAVIYCLPLGDAFCHRQNGVSP